MSEAPTTADLQARLKGKYSPPAWLMLWEVRNGTGYAHSPRFADALAFGVWPSRGLSIIGFEIKASRNDWLNELKNPAKADAIGKHCDEWWLVAGNDVATMDEIPKTWGWLAPSKRGGLQVMKSAIENPAVEISRPLLMSIVRNMEEGYVPKAMVEQTVANRMEDALRQHHDNSKYELERLRLLAKKVREFKEASGIDLEGEWRMTGNPKAVGEVVKACLDGTLPYTVAQIRSDAEKVEDVLSNLTALPIFSEVRKVVMRGRKSRQDQKDRQVVALQKGLADLQEKHAAALATIFGMRNATTRNVVDENSGKLGEDTHGAGNKTIR